MKGREGLKEREGSEGLKEMKDDKKGTSMQRFRSNLRNTLRAVLPVCKTDGALERGDTSEEIERRVEGSEEIEGRKAAKKSKDGRR